MCYGAPDPRTGSGDDGDSAILAALCISHGGLPSVVVYFACKAVTDIVPDAVVSYRIRYQSDQQRMSLSCIPTMYCPSISNTWSRAASTRIPAVKPDLENRA